MSPGREINKQPIYASPCPARPARRRRPRILGRGASTKRNVQKAATRMQSEAPSEVNWKTPGHKTAREKKERQGRAGQGRAGQGRAGQGGAGPCGIENGQRTGPVDTSPITPRPYGYTRSPGAGRNTSHITDKDRTLNSAATTRKKHTFKQRAISN